MSAKDEEIRSVVTELDGLLDALRANVDALSAILVPPAANGHSDGQEVPVP